MTTRRVQGAAAVAATVVIALTAVPAAQATALFPHLRTVSAGQSIQAAVDSARPGDEIVVLAGTYPGSVRITTPGVTLRGTGPDTVIVPGVSGPRNACATAGDGICVTGTATDNAAGVTVENLTVRGFRTNGLNASYADRLTVTGVTARDNGEEGISQERSVRGVFRGDTARDNGQAGIFLANTVSTEGGATDTLGTRVTANRLTGNRFGVVVRRLRDLTVERNLVSGNCGGVFVIGDENVPRAGDLDIVDNEIVGNNKYCAAAARLPFIQGTGVLLTGTDGVRVTGNTILDNTGTSPMSGGVVLFNSNVGVHDTRNAVSRNIATGNAPADLAVRDHGAGNTFLANTCGSAAPVVAGRCDR
ncbi:right-handed parallel beta-helix repeat-containing protein [Streptomyces sp. SL13]|uniref:Right-handed parallel beta-helix repeat-containing protein n=1 Tax=Streptantibioticus silvisoli TaxID=2705255 RepID=A0AA90H7F0_9ACTN|nr:right-handed parallel beta-helix repeat-containing protein [Streptantibioticus silvisoli]MDI5972355.1 right-handed parallel beta-helix repeat-containing protein [Streptantibioticus silvisoli]